MDEPTWHRWQPLLGALYDGERYTGRRLAGQCLTEWLEYAQHDFDDVDRLYLEYETIGG